jgi:hypothetical protein
LALFEPIKSVFEGISKAFELAKASQSIHFCSLSQLQTLQVFISHLVFNQQSQFPTQLLLLPSPQSSKVLQSLPFFHHPHLFNRCGDILGDDRITSEERRSGKLMQITAPW